jgi:hypothetical protein
VRLEGGMSGMRQELSDKHKNTIGFIETDSKGVQSIYDKHHNLLGTFDPAHNVTSDRHQNTFGYGNLLAMLLPPM